MASNLFPLIKAWCAQVKVAPELKRIAVFNRGTPNGFRVSMPTGGHRDPSTGAGDKLLWK